MSLFGRSRHLDVDGMRIARKDRFGMHPVKAGALAVVLVLIGTYFGFAKDVPFTRDFQLEAVFRQANSVRPGSAVRIAGVNVGEVAAVRTLAAGGAVLTISVAEQGLPIHKDATMKLRPRTFLEGNYFVDLHPGTPSAPLLSDGDTINVAHTATPVQFDEVLAVLQSDTRQDLRDVLDGLGTGLTYSPKRADDADQDPDVHGESAARSLRDALGYGGKAFRNGAILAEATGGTEPHDLSRLIAGVAGLADGLSRNEQQLKDLVTRYNALVRGLGAHDERLREAVALLAPTVVTANRALSSLRTSFPSTRAFAREILPGVRQTAATFTASFPWMAEARKLVGPAELPALTGQLRPAGASLASFQDSAVDLFGQLELLSRCFDEVFLPTGDVVLEDGPATIGGPNYKAFLYTLVGYAGESQGFDGNGPYLRVRAGGGPVKVASEKLKGEPAGQDELFGNADAEPLGVRPRKPSKLPPFRPDFPCHKNTPPNLNGPAAALGPGFRVVSRSGVSAADAARGGGGR